MRLPRAALATFACCGALAFAEDRLPAAAEFPPDDEIRAILRGRVDSGNGVGLVVGVLDAKGKRVIAYGRQDREGGPPVDGDTRFEIGSLTKLFTSALLADMAVRGEVALLDPVRKYLPSEVRVPKVSGRDITLMDLSIHASGLPRIPADLRSRDFENPYADYSVANLYEDLGALPDASGLPPPEARYSNLGVGLLGHALARRGGKDYETLLRERVLGPLGLRATSVALDAAGQAHLAWPHYATLARAKPWDFPTLAGAGALRSTANDLLAFASANLDSGKESGELVEALRLQRTPVDPVHALGWFVRGWWLVHEGATAGSVSFIAMDTREKRAVVVLGNSANPVADIGNHLADAGRPLKVLPRREAPRAVTLADPAAFDEFAGTYRIAPDFAIVASREGTRFFIQATNQARLEIVPYAADKFFLRAVDAKISFVRHEGRVTHLLLDQDQRVQRGDRVPAE